LSSRALTLPHHNLINLTLFEMLTQTINTSSLVLPVAHPSSSVAVAVCDREESLPVPTFIEIDDDNNNNNRNDLRQQEQDVASSSDNCRIQGALSESDLVDILDDLDWVEESYYRSDNNNSEKQQQPILVAMDQQQHLHQVSGSFKAQLGAASSGNNNLRSHHDVIHQQQQGLYGVVDEQTLQSLFVQADCGDRQRAARRMGVFFANKLSLFGVDKVGQKITLNDLDEEDHILLQSGYLQFLPERDQSGRPVLFFDMDAAAASSSSWDEQESNKSLVSVCTCILCFIKVLRLYVSSN
jgi:hypothetical protein